VQSCIFNGNASSGGSGSGVAGVADNNSTLCTLEVQYCTFYNNPAPVLNKMASSTGNMSWGPSDCIVWQGSGYYSSPVSVGGVTFTNSDLDMATPGGGNTNNDPEFVDAAGGDFHLQPCSPDIDAGGYDNPDPATDFDGNPRMQNNSVDYGAYESSKTLSVANSATPATYCQYVTAVALTATGTSVLWYTAATGGVGSAVAPVPSTVAAGSTKYWVTQTAAGACESIRTPVTVTVSASPAAPVAASVGYCENAAAVALTASGTGLLWYTGSTGGVGSAVAPVPPTTANGVTTWYVSQTSGCESPRTEVDVVVAAPPAAPLVGSASVSYCENVAAVALTATGTDLLWYNTAVGGVGVSAAPVPSTVASGTTSWYVSQTSGCESPRTEVDVVVDALPMLEIAPVATNLCAGSSITLGASGASTYEWSPATGLSDPSIGDPTAVLQENIQYTITGTDVNGCVATAQVSLEVGGDCLGYYIPSAFSPNGDGNNDLFRVRTSDVTRSFRMLVFNRFGGKVFESENIGAGWNGAIGGSSVSTGTYVYLIAITTSAGGLLRREGPLN
jgi:gliding motility-associated-like protein